jgi:hypothetical protein
MELRDFFMKFVSLQNSNQMAQNKTQKTEQSVEGFLNSIDHETRKKDGFELLKMMSDITGEPAKMWGTSIIGFGDYHYKYESGREGDFFIVGFSPRKQSMSLYLMTGFDGYQEMLSKIGKHKTGKSCLYINKLEDIDREALRDLINTSYKAFKNKG